MRRWLVVFAALLACLTVAGADGFYRLKFTDSRWQIIAPDGNEVFIRGVDHVRYRGFYTYAKGAPFSHYERWNDAHYPDRAAWCDETVARLHKWGFNMLGSGYEPQLSGRGFAYIKSLEISHGMTVGTDNNPKGIGKEGLWICPHAGSPGTEFPNVFHPDFAAYCDREAAAKCAPLIGDRDLLGYCIDNELAWWGKHNWVSTKATGLFDAVLDLPADHTARIELEKFLKSRGAVAPTAADKREFLRLVAERYFSVTTAAIRRHDSNHLILGVRFAGIELNDDVVWEVAGKYCDVMTFNCYPWADLERNVVYARKTGRKRIADEFSRLSAVARRPLFITEWGFPGLDTPCPSTRGAGMRTRTQKERARAALLFARTMMALPSVVGYSFFMWVDEPPEGISPLFPENCNYGLVNERGEPYAPLTAMFQRLHADVGRYRQAGLPTERLGGKSAAVFAAEHRLVPAACFRRDGDGWEWTNDAGMRLKGKVGSSMIADSVTLGGRELGSLGAMVNFVAGGSTQWSKLDKVVSATFRHNTLELVVSGHGTRGVQFEFTFAITLDATRPEFLYELREVACTGSQPIEFKMFYLNPYSPFAREGALPASAYPKWGEPLRAGWQAKDGRVFGASTQATDVFDLSFYTDPKLVHPDAGFMPSSFTRRFNPGEKRVADGGMWLLCFGAL